MAKPQRWSRWPWGNKNGSMPVPPQPALRVVVQPGPVSPQQYGGLGAPAGNTVASNPNIGNPGQANVKKRSDQRFRSFAERYVIARAHFFRVPLSEHTEDQWSCVMDAKRVYAMIERVGQNIEPEEGVF